MSEKGSSSFSAAEVIAPGRTFQHVQFPSPVYFVRWVDERYAIVGAGGGGRRFGMANLLAIISVDTSQRNSDSSSGNGKQQQQQKQGEGEKEMLSSSSSRSWDFVTAIDMEGNIPWCASSFLRCVDTTRRARGVVGYIAVSHITCFSFLEVYHCRKNGKLAIQTLACISLPSDPKNPDKKPIAIVQGAVIVSHDEGGVHVYGFNSLLQHVHPSGRGGSNCTSSSGSNAAQSNVEVKRDSHGAAANVGDDSSLGNHNMNAAEDATVEAAPAIVRNAQPIAVWSLPARLNDLHANRFFVPKHRKDREKRGRRTHSNYVLIAALVQDKTLRLGTMKLPKLPGKNDVPKEENKDNESEDVATRNLVDACVFTGKDCRIPFSLMKSSMRLVHVFGVEDVDPSVAESVWLKTRRLHCEEGIRGAMPVATFLVVVYDVLENQSYIITAKVLSTAAAAHVKSSLSSTTTTITTTTTTTTEQEMMNTTKKTSKQLALQVIFASQHSPLVKEGITSISPCHYSPNSCDGAAVNGEGVGTIIPSHWLAATVEGTLLLLEYGSDGIFQSTFIRPSKNKREAIKFPALHREPISCVAVSSMNDVLTSDIAQNVVLSVLPFWDSIDSSAVCSEGVKNDKVIAPCTRSSPMIPTLGAPMLLADSVKEMTMRPKSIALALFPPKQETKPSLLIPFSDVITLKAPLLMALIVVPLMAFVAAYWML